MLRKITVSLLCIFICIISIGSTLSAEEKKRTVSIQLENDFFGGGTDRHFSHGTRIEFISEPLQWVTGLADRLPWFDSKKNKNTPDALEGRGTISIGQNIYTPENTYTTNLVHGERPYAGWLYMGFGLMAEQGNEYYERYDKVQLELGIIGPLSYAENIQTFWHSLLGLHVPEGWDHQLGNEPGFALYYEQAYRIFPKKKVLGLEYDIVPHIGGCVGNVFTYISGGYVVRIGQDLKKDFGPPRIRPSLPGGGYSSHHGFNWNMFIGLDGRIVLQNVFLDGNTFTRSHSVNKKIAVGDIQAGLNFRWSRFGISYTQIFRTREFRGQDSDDIFGSVNLSWNF